MVVRSKVWEPFWELLRIVFWGRGYFVMEAPEPASALCFCMCNGASRNAPEHSPHIHTSHASKNQNSALTIQKQKCL